jgi:hypothetical protein
LPILAYKRITPTAVHDKIKQCEDDKTDWNMLRFINGGKIIPENITGSTPKIKKEKRCNDPERSMLIDVYILLFFKKVIIIKTAHNHHTHRHDAVGDITVLAEIFVDTLVEVQDNKDPCERNQPVFNFEIIAA